MLQKERQTHAMWLLGFRAAVATFSIPTAKVTILVTDSQSLKPEL
jgi:hypothetical protein